MFFHGGIQFLAQIITHIGQASFLLVGPAHTALILVGLLVVFLFGVLGITLAAL